MMTLGLLGYSESIFNFSCSHSHAKTSIKSRAYSKIELKSLASNFLSIILYAFFSSSNFVLYRLLLLLIHGLMCFIYAFCLPFYSISANYARSLSHYFVSVSSMLMLIGYCSDSSFFCVLGLIFIVPLSMII